jgi:hypothetical protein
MICQEFKRGKKQRTGRKYRKSTLRMKSTRSMLKRRRYVALAREDEKKL